MKLGLTHKETRELIVEYSGRGIPLPKLVVSVDLSLSFPCACKPHISTYFYWLEVTNKSSTYRPM